ncbi:unnamed protein product [Caenorhabditis brenneri]
MQWFAGNVTTAIQISRKNKALLIVYISTDSEDGKLFDEFWQHVDSSNLLCPVVGIKLKAGETAASQFADIYPTPIVPAAYLIDQNGKPLEVITFLVGNTYDKFRSKFDKATAQFVNGIAASQPTSSSQSASTAQPQAATPVSTQSVAQSVAPSATQAPPPKPTPAAQPSSTTQEMTPELAEKVARARALLEQKKQKDAEKQREAEKQMKEEVSKAREAKQERDDKAMMEAAKQRKKEKMEAEKEKERILAQIKADREDARKRFSGAANTAAPQTESAKQSTVGKAVPSDRCRLQIRMPDGSSFVEEFPSNDVLNSLVEIIRQKPSINGASFEVQQPYPRRVFTVDDYSKTFLENSLTPCTSLIVVLKSGSSGPASFAVSMPSVSIFSWLFYPITAIWGIFCSMLGWDTNNQSNSRKKESSSASRQAPGAGARGRGMPRSAEVRRRGNVAGLENPNDDDPEERASFNGNSTQFM